MNTNPTTDESSTCTAYIVNEHSKGTHHCALEAEHTGGEFGEDHAGPVDDQGVRYCWSDSAIGAVPHQPAVPVSSPPPDQTADRDRYAEVTAAARAEANRLALSEALGLGTGAPWAAIRERVAVLAVLPPPVDRSTGLREAAEDLATAFGDPMAKHIGILGASYLRRRARETETAQTAEAQAEAEPETPLEKRLRYSERRNDELREECLRRGRKLLGQSEKIIALEQQLDEVRAQLSAEILRAGQAEGELRRLADEAREEQEAQAHLDQLADELPSMAVEAQQQTEPACPDPIECGHEAALGQAQQEVKRVREVCDHLRRVSVLADGEPHTDRERGVIQAVTRVLAALDVQPAVVAAVAGEEPDTETWDVPDARPGTTDHTLTRPAQHAPGVAVRCADCRAKGHTVCMDAAASQPGKEA